MAEELKVETEQVFGPSDGDKPNTATPTPFEVECGLTHRAWQNRKIFTRRGDFKINAEQVERGLNDSDQFVRYAFANRKDYTPTPEQIERSFVDGDHWILLAFAYRIDFEPTPDQIKSGLKNDVEEIRKVFELNKEKWEQINQAKELREKFQSNSKKMRKAL